MIGEPRDDPDLCGKPVAVGRSRERGVVAAASYEARKFGVWSAMPSVTAKRQCPDLIFVKPRFEIYKAVSSRSARSSQRTQLDGRVEGAHVDMDDLALAKRAYLAFVIVVGHIAGSILSGGIEERPGRPP